MEIFKKIEAGGFLGYGQPDRSIDTMLSRLYFFGDRVLKRYKHIDAFYGNMSDHAYRHYFHHADFFWNNYMAPEIYLSLKGIKKNADAYELAEMHEAEDFLIEMARIDDSRTLTQSLLGVEATAELLASYIDLISDKLRELLIVRQEELKEISSLGWQELFAINISDLKNWIHLADKHIPRDWADEIVDLIDRRVRADGYFRNYDASYLSASIDNNCDNLLQLDVRPSFIDIMPPKKEWKVVDEYWAISRTIVDAYVLGGQALGDAAQKHYQKKRAVPDAIFLAYAIRAALLQATYRYLLGQEELARRYREFAEEKAKELT